MTWTGNATNELPTYGDVENAVTNKLLQWAGLPPGAGAFAALECWTNYEYEFWIEGNGDLGTDNAYPTRSEVEAWRLWDPSVNSDIPASFAAVNNAGTPGVDIQLTWTDDADVPSWARTQTGVEIWFCSGSTTCTPSTLLTVVDYGVGSYNHAGLTDGVHYRYRARYRNKTNTALVGPYTAITGATATGGSPS